jgi:hypothetical protein
VLLRFDNLAGNETNQFPPGSRIDAAMLDLASVAGNATGDGGHLHRLLQPWEDTTTTWNSWGGDGIQADDVEAASIATTKAGSTNLDPNVQGGFNSFEVTTDVQAWLDGTSNYGWVWLPWTGGGDGWGFGTAESVTERERPRLRVFFTAGAGNVSAAVIQPLSVGPSQVEVKFSGTAGRTYSVWRASSPIGPWNSIGTATVGSDGHAAFMDNSPLLDSGFYRVIYP